jgi:hypothetical protein
MSLRFPVCLSSDGVGDDAVSWGCFYKSGSAIYSRWSKATIPADALSPHHKLDRDRSGPTNIAIAVDFDKKVMLLSINGEEAITVIENFEASTGLVPAFSLQGMLECAVHCVVVLFIWKCIFFRCRSRPRPR